MTNSNMTFDNFDVAQFWKDPKNVSDEIKTHNRGKMYRFCQPEFYLTVHWGEKIALSVMSRYAKKDWSFLELGCNTGKVMAALYRNGYKDIRGIEINPHAIEVGRAAFPELQYIPVTIARLGDAGVKLPEVDVTYACGVYMHIPPVDEYIFEEIAACTRRLILTTENEQDTDEFFKWARNYRTVFEGLGWKQVEEQSGALYPPLPASSIVRVFVKA